MLYYICHMVKKLIIIYAILCPLISLCQEHIDLFSTHYKLVPTANSANTKNLTERSFTINALLPIQRENGDAFITGFSLEQASISFENDSLNFEESYLPTRLQLGYQFSLRDNSSLMLLALPKISSNWKNIADKHFQFGVYALYSFKPNPNWKVKLGGYYNSELFGPFFVPLISADYYGFENWLFYGTIPVNYNIMYLAGEKWRFGFRYQGLVNTIYNDTQFQNTYWERKPQEALGVIEYYLQPNMVLRGMAGHTVLRSIDLYGQNQSVDTRISAIGIGDNRESLLSAKDAPVFQLSFIYRYELK